MAELEVLVLGPLALVGETGPVPPPAMVQRLVAALLLADGQVCQPDDLVDVLWDGAAPPSARKLVHVYVSQLRKALPPHVAIETIGGGYSLRLPAEALDAARFERLLGECGTARRDGNAALAASLADQALALWRGRAFGELAYEEVARAESDRLEELRLVAVEERLDAQLTLGRHRDVLGEALALAGEHPLRERVRELAMLALYRCGRQAEALEQYAAVRTLLNEELGLEPGPALRELQRQILQHDPELGREQDAPAAAISLPASPNALIGRRHELEALGGLLLRRDHRLIVLTGAGGSGKSRLALEAARETGGSFANGAVLVELAPLRDPELLLPTIAQAVGAADAPAETLLDSLAELLRSRELLLVLDNVEHLRAETHSFVELLARAPRLTLLVTSRAVLHLSGEHVFPVDPLDDGPAIELFEERARSLRPDFRVTTEDRDVVREICRRVDRLPLAIELAAARIRTLRPDALLERMGQRLSVLTGGPRDLPARQQTLRATLEWSVRLLSDEERSVLARLSVFPGGATLEAAERVCGANLDTLAALVDHNLVRRVDAADETRFTLLETIREYAEEGLGDERVAAERTLAEYLATLVERAVLRGAGSEVWLPRLDAELDNLRSAFAAARAVDDPELELRLVGGLWRYWWNRGLLIEGRSRIEAALARPAGSATVARACALAGAAGLAYSQGDHAAAKRLAAEAVPSAQAAGSLFDESSALVVLGVTATAERDWEAARAHLERSMGLKEKLGLEPVVEMANLGLVALDSGDYGAAVELFDDLLASHRRAGSAEGIGLALLNIGLARYKLGELKRARADYEAARIAFQQIGFRAHLANALLGLAGVEAAERRFDLAAELLGRASAELGEIGWGEVFAPEVAAEVESAARDGLGDGGFERAFEVGRVGGQSGA